MSGDPPYLKALKGEMPVMQMGWFRNYKNQFISTGSFRPVVHVIAGVMTLGYFMDFAFHLRHERHSAIRKRMAAGDSHGHH